MVMNADQIRSALSCGHQGCDCSKGGVKTHCPGPSHRNGDQHPSLGVTEQDGKVLVCCYGGCEQADVISELQARDLWPRKDETARTNGHAPLRIVATYDYQQADGGFNFQVVRIEPKDFRQRRRNTRGGWEWKAGDRSLLYHLPELLAASDDVTVYIVEGEKDVDRLISLGLVATTSAGGAGKWSDANSQWLAGRRVVILADNDVAGEKDVAVKLRSLRPVAASVALVPLSGLPDGGDVSDWLDAGGTPERLVAMAETALKAAPEPDPKPALTVVERPALPAFPTDVLPDSLRRLIESASDIMAVPVEFLGLPFLVLAGSAIGNAWEFWVDETWKEGTNLYGGIVAEPGSKKSPALNLAQRALQKVQQRLAYEHAIRMREHKEELALIERQPKADRPALPDPPRFPHIYTTDATTEALAVMLLNSKGIAVIKDELVGWVSGMDQYHGGKGNDRQHYLEAWSRKSLKIDRKGSVDDPIIVPNPCLSVIGGVQPDMVSKMINESGGDDGFVDRMLWAYPPPMPNRWTRRKVEQGSLAAVERLFENLFALQGAEQPDGSMSPRAAMPDRDAEAVWEHWANAHYAEEQSADLPYSLRGAWSKFEGQYLRLALILHVTHAVDQGICVPALISGETMAKAQVLVDFFKEHAREALGAARTSRSSLEDRILRALKTRGPMTTTELYGVLGGGQVKADRLQAAMERLEEQAYVVAETVKRPGGGRPSKTWSYPEKEPLPFRHGGGRR